MLFTRLEGTSNSDEDVIDASDSDMQMNSADESAEVPELYDEVLVIIFLYVVDIQSRNLHPNRETHCTRAQSWVCISPLRDAPPLHRRCRTNGNRLRARTETACAHGREPLSSTGGTACAHGPRTDRNRLRARPGTPCAHGPCTDLIRTGTACDKAESWWAPPPQPPQPPGSGCLRRRRLGTPGIRPVACHNGAARSAIKELAQPRHSRIFGTIFCK